MFGRDGNVGSGLWGFVKKFVAGEFLDLLVFQREIAKKNAKLRPIDFGHGGHSKLSLKPHQAASTTPPFRLNVVMNSSRSLLIQETPRLRNERMSGNGDCATFV